MNKFKEVFKKIHIIHNFPEGYPWYKKVFGNILYMLAGIIIHPRESLLTHADVVKVRFALCKGDIVLVGNFRESSTVVLRGPITHSLLYVGNKKFIHAVGDGVTYLSLHQVVTHYDSLAIVRLPKKIKRQRKIIKSVINYAKEQVGKPYDYEFKKGEDAFFCSELVNAAYTHAGYDTGLKLFSSPSRVKQLRTATRPEKLANDCNFDVVFVSHNLKFDGKLKLMAPKQKD